MVRYSERLSWSLAPNALSLLLSEKKKHGTPVLDLTVSNPTAVLRSPETEIRQALHGVESFRYRPDPFGLPESREAIAHFYREEGFEVAASRIALTASTSEAYAILFKLLCDPGDEILVPAPSYPLFEYLAALENVKPVPYRLRYDGSWFIDFQNLRERVSARSRAIVLVNPNNPTGSFLKREELQTLIELARGKRMPIVCDEVFMSYEFGAQARRVKTLIDQHSVLSFSLNGLSKTAAMPQMKLAWIAINGPKEERQMASERLEVILDTYLSVNTPVQLAISALLEIGARSRSELLARCNENLRAAGSCLRNSPIHVLHVEGGWSIILQLPKTLGEEQWVWEMLQRQNVLLQPGFFFDMSAEAYAVASLITDPEIFEEGIARLRQFVSGHC